MQIKLKNQTFEAEFDKKELSTLLCALFVLEDRVDHIDVPLVEMYQVPETSSEQFKKLAFSKNTLSNLKTTLAELWKNT